MSKTKVSIITPLYNSSAFLLETLESILNQTYQNLEIILVNDGSTDNTEELVRSIRDNRITFLNSDKNLGIASARNLGIERATGDLIAFLDHDDISLPRRIERQVDLFQNDDNLGLCGTAVRTFGDEKEHLWNYPTDSHFLKARLLFDCPFAASSVMIRSDCIEREGHRFNPTIQGVDDYEMWVKISKKLKITNIPEALTLYRLQPQQYSSGATYKRDLTEMVWGIQSRLLRDLGISPSEKQKKLHLDMGVRWSFSGEESVIQEAAEWLVLLHEANLKNHVYEETSFRSVLLERWGLIFGAYEGSPLESWKLYRKNPASKWDDNYHKKSMALLWKAILAITKRKTGRLM